MKEKQTYDSSLNNSNSGKNQYSNRDVENYQKELDSIIEEDSNKYKVTINFSDLENGHFDFQAWFKLTSGEVVPFFGVYHYEVKRGSFVTLSYEKLPKDIVIKELYYTLNYYDGLSVSTYNNVVK